MSVKMRFVIIALTLSGAAMAACSDSVTGPGMPPEGPANPRLIKRTISYLTSAPNEMQAGEFFYDDQGRLERYEFGVYGGEWNPTIRKEFQYREDGLPQQVDTFVRTDSVWHYTGAVRYGYHNDRGLVNELRVEQVESRTGRVLVRTVGVGYNEYDQIVEIRDGVDNIHYTYDDAGNVVEVYDDDIRFPANRTRVLTYGDAWSPFHYFPLYHGTHEGILSPEPSPLSLHLSDSFKNVVDGEDSPASQGSAVIEVAGDGYPTRREYTFFNTADPDLQDTAVTIYEYYSD